MASGGHAPLTLQAAGPALMDLARQKPDPDLLKHRPWRECPGGNALEGTPWQAHGLDSALPLSAGV